MTDRFQRTKLLLGEEKFNMLSDARVLIFGLGGVGGYTAEALARGGIGSLTLVDGDKVDITNINRQIIADDNTVGQMKASAFKDRIKLINPNCVCTAVNSFYTAENQDTIGFSKFDYIVDAIDTVSSKLLIIERAKREGIPVISAMGTARKLDPTLLKIGDIYDTSGCPLARVMRRELRRRGIDKLTVVWSSEEPIMPGGDRGRDAPIGSVSFVPSVAGLYIAGKVISDIAGTGGLYGR